MVWYTMPMGVVPACPRCGYDLSGDIAAWNGEGSLSCPFAGRCSECGLEFEWADIFNPFRKKVRGFIEHEDRGLLRTAWRTWWLAARPWRFWGLVRIEFEPRPGRMVLWLALLTATAWIIGPLVCNAAQLYLLLAKATPWRPDAFIEPWLDGLFSRDYSLSGATYSLALRHAPGFVLGLWAASAVAPLTLLCLPDTRKLAKVRVAHVARAAVYGLAWLIPVLVLRSANLIGHAITWIAWSGWAKGGVAGRAPFAVEVYNGLARLVLHNWLWLLFVGLVWSAAWWWWALRTGWRVKEYRKVMQALVIIGLLAAAAAALMADDGYRLFL